MTAPSTPPTQVPAAPDLASGVSAARTSDEVLGKIPFSGRIKDAIYLAAGPLAAVGIIATLYVLVTQASYWGDSLKPIWDNLDRIWHFAAIPGIGNWLVAHWDIGRHLYLRGVPETVLSYALVMMLFATVKPLKRRTPAIDKILIFAHMPSPYQARYNRWIWHRGQPRPERTSGLQYLLLVPSMLIAMLPGTIICSVAAFGLIALAHKYGITAGWLNPDAFWVSLFIGLGAGKLAGHRPPLKAGQDVQRFFLGGRLAAAYTAESLLTSYHDGPRDGKPLAAARDALTSMRGTQPGAIYPARYIARYDRLLELRAPAGKRSTWQTIVITAVAVVSAVFAIYGLYITKGPLLHLYKPGHPWIP